MTPCPCHQYQLTSCGGRGPPTLPWYGCLGCLWHRGTMKKFLTSLRSLLRLGQAFQQFRNGWIIPGKMSGSGSYCLIVTRSKRVLLTGGVCEVSVTHLHQTMKNSNFHFRYPRCVHRRGERGEPYHVSIKYQTLEPDSLFH